MMTAFGRAAAVEGIGNIALHCDEALESMLVESLEDRDELVRAAAVQALISPRNAKRGAFQRGILYPYIQTYIYVNIHI